MLSKTSRKDVAKDKLSEAVTAAAIAAEAGRERLAPVVNTAADKLTDAADAVEPQLTKAKKSARRATKKTSAAFADATTAAEPHLSKAKKAALQAAQEARAAGDQAYAALPDRARTTVEAVVPAVTTTKRRKKGTLLIALGLLAGAGAVALFLNGKKKTATSVPTAEGPHIERRDALAAEAVGDGPAPVSGAEDAVGETEQQIDAAVSGTRRARHAARE